MIAFIITIVKLLVIIGIVATIHEFGHFIMAKLFKVGVDEFSIGFGPKIVQKKYKGTVYSLRWLPLGGYCAIDGEGGASENPNSFNNIKAWKKIVILCMGVVFNVILAVIIFLSIAFSFPTYNTKIAELAPNSILEQAGVSAGDTIQSIDGKKVSIREHLVNPNIKDGKKDVEVVYIRDGKTHETVVKDAVKDVGFIGITFRLNEDSTAATNVIEMVASGGVAAEAGIKAEDKITEVAGVKTNNSAEIVNLIKENPNKQIDVVIGRKGETITKQIVPKAKPQFNLQIVATEQVKTTLPLAFASAYNNVETIAGSYVDLFTGKVNIKEMSGLVGIGEVVSNTNGWLELLNLLGIISLAIGIANILPFPPLDGGKIVIVLIEGITRKKVPEKVEATISYIGFGLLILLTIYVTFNDIIRIL